ncbi:MAG: histidine kinase [Flavobacteriales bacterium]|nr:histidine kinase [Flavobacteriales bacterium]
MRGTMRCKIGGHGAALWAAACLITWVAPATASAASADLKALLARASTLSNGSVPLGQAHKAVATMIAEVEALKAGLGPEQRVADSLLMELHIREAFLYGSENAGSRARASYRAALAIAPTGMGMRSSDVRYWLAESHWKEGRQDSAIATMEAGSKALAALKDSAGMRQMLWQEEQLRTRFGDHRGAILACQRLLKMDQAMGDRRNEAYTQMALARHAARIGLEAAFDHAQSAYKGFEEVGDASGAMSAIDLLITTYDITAQDKQVLQLITDGLKRAEDRGVAADIARFHDRMGRFRMRTKEYATALSHHRQGLALVGGSMPGVALPGGTSGAVVLRRAELLRDIGLCWIALTRTDSALLFLKASDALAEQEGLEDVDPTVDLGELSFAQGAFAEALRYGERALNRGRARNDLSLVNRASLLLYEVYKQRNDTRAALRMHELYQTTSDSLGREQFRMGLMKRQIETDFQAQMLADSIESAQAVERERLGAEVARLEAAQEKTRSRLLLIVGALVLIASGVFFWLDRKRRKERFEKEAAHLETQALRSQMNPHFIFNALNSINAFVQKNEPDKAAAFLSRFARLMRLVLENSRQSEVPLKDDLEALDNYLHLERARSGEKFDYTILVDPTIDQEEVHVPPLVIQPFVENAIWHGMAGKEEKGHITLSVQRRGSELVMAIEDDGVGRHAPKVTSQETTQKKTSLATTITKARLDLVQKQKGKPAGFKYIDLPQGTRVELSLPIDGAG